MKHSLNRWKGFNTGFKYEKYCEGIADKIVVIADKQGVKGTDTFQVLIEKGKKE